MAMTLWQTIKYCVWLNMCGKHQNRTITPWDIQFVMAQHHGSTDQIVAILPVVFVVMRTGIPISKMLNAYAKWGHLDYFLEVTYQRAVQRARESR